ncbi:hypothetical protein PAENIP36_17820 [Paenibacillus sp. P36]
MGKQDFGVTNGHTKRYSPKMGGKSVETGTITSFGPVRIFFVNIQRNSGTGVR